MRNYDELEQRLLAIDPATDLDAEPDGPTGRRLRTRAMAAGDAARPLPHRGPRKRVVVAAVAGLMVLSTVTAMAAGMFDPDPAQVASILEAAEESGVYEVKTEDWRPTLRSERVICAHEDGSLGSTSVAHPEDFPIDEGIDENDLIAACSGGTDQTRHLDIPQQFTICEGTMPAEEVDATLESMVASGGQVVEGELTGDRPGFPVVLGWDADCEQASIGTSPERTELGAWTGASMQAVNRAREVEIGLTAAALDRCLSPEEARAMASEARAELDGDWVVVTATPIPEDAAADQVCTRVWLDGRGRGLLDIGAPS